MDIEWIRRICLSYPGTTEDVKWGDNLCLCVKEKIFLILGLDHVPVTVSFKVSDEEFAEWASRDGFKPAPYMARNKWVHTNDISNLTEKEWKERVQVAYELVKAKLSKKLQRELGGTSR